MKISIITICYNSSITITRTIESVLAQKDVCLEYLIIDGASKDNTVSIAESYRKQFEAKGVSYIVKSEPDKGIYDAMNQAAEQANGEILFFLNKSRKFSDIYNVKLLYNSSKYPHVL